MLKFLKHSSNLVNHVFSTSYKLCSTNSVTKIQQQASSIKLTDSCVNRLQELSVKNPGKHLRVAVEGGGCSGFQYIFSLDPERSEDDCVVERDGVQVIVDKYSLEYLEGATIDYYSELIKSAFRVLTNPKAERGCSCGASFSLKD